MVGGIVGHAGDHQRGAAAPPNHVFVHEHRQAQAPHLGDPLQRAGIIFVVAGDEEHAVARLQARQRFGMHGQALHAAIDQVAGDGDGVGAELVDLVDDRVQVGPLDGRADVDVRDLGDGIAVQFGRQVPDRHVDLHHPRHPPRIDVADHGHGQRHQRHGQRAAVGNRRRQRAEGQQRQQHQVAQQGGDQQRREQAHRQQAEPGDQVRPAPPAQRGRHQADRHQRADQAQQEDGEGIAGQRQPEVGQQAHADIDQQQYQQGEDDDEASARAHGGIE